MSNIHFRYTSKSNPWKVLRTYYDGEESINVSIGKLKGMSMKDSKNTYIPSFVYSDFKKAINTRNIYKESYEENNPNYMYLIYNDGVSDSLQAQELLTYSEFVKLDTFERLTTYAYSPEIYYYENPYGFSYVSYNNKNMLYGNGADKFGRDINLRFIDWRYPLYLKTINLAYIDEARTISYNVFRLNEAFQDKDVERFTNDIGIFHSRIKDGYSFTALPTFDKIHYESKYLDISTDEARTSLLSNFNQFIFNGLYVMLQTPISNNSINAVDINGNGCLSLRSYDEGSRIKSIYGRLDIDDNVDVLSNISTGSRKVSISNITKGSKLKIYGSSFDISNDIEKDDISYPLSKLAEKYNKDAVICVDTRLKSIRKDRGDLIVDSIYSKDVDYICGYNNMTGKHICTAGAYTTQTIDMPVYTNTAKLDIVGLSSYGKGMVTSSSISYLQYPSSGNSMPFINFNPQDYYNKQGEYDTKDSAIDYATENNIEKYSILHNEVNDKYILYTKYENMWCSMYSGFEIASDTARQYNITTPDGTYNEKSRQINGDDLHGLDNGRFIAYIKFDSRTNYDLFLNKSKTSYYSDARLRCYFYLNTYSTNNSSQSYINIPPKGDFKSIINVIYTYYIDDDGNYNYTSETKYAELDKIYALIINPSITDPEDYRASTKVKLCLCEVTNEDGSIKDEHIPYLDSLQCNRNCVKINTKYAFSITYLNERYEWRIDATKLSTYFDITYSEDDDTEITSLSFKSDMIYALKNDTTVKGNEAFMVPSKSDGKICVDIDKGLGNNNIFDASNPICIPQYSGCTFVKYE